MPIQISCPSCQRQLRVPDNLVGQMVKCPSCQNTFVATVEDAAPKEEPPHEEELPSRSSRRPAREDRYREDEPPRSRAPREDDFAPHRGTIILVLGILSLTGLGILTGIPAWIMGNSDMKEIRAGRMDPEGESNTNIGRILGMVSTIIFVVTIIPACLCFCLIPMAQHR